MASLLKIVSTGVQDKRLQPPEEQPDLGAFLTVIVKAGRYGTAWARIDFDTKPDFGKSGVIRIPTQGELVGRIMLVTQMPDIKTQQDKAYRARKVPKLFSNNYVDVELVENFEYLPGYSTVYPKGASMAAIPDDSFTVLRNLIKTTGLSDDDITGLFAGLGEDKAVIYGSSVLYAYKKTYTLGTGNVGVGDIDIAFRSDSVLNSIATYLYKALGPECRVNDPNLIVLFNDANGNSIRDSVNYSGDKFILLDKADYKLVSSSAPDVNQMGSFNVEKFYQTEYSYITDAIGNIKGTGSLDTRTVLIYLPGKTPIQLVSCSNGLIANRSLAQYIQESSDFTVSSGTFDGTSLAEPYSNDIKNNVAVYTQDIPNITAKRLDWMLYRLQKMISRGFTVYFESEGQINDWNSIPKRVPLWGATLESSTDCPFNTISGSLLLSPDYIPPIINDSFTALRNLIKTTGLFDSDITGLFSGLGEDTAVIYGSSILYAYKKVNSLGPDDVAVGDIDIAFRSAAVLNVFAKFLYNIFGGDCVIVDFSSILTSPNDSIINDILPIGLIYSDKASYKLISTTAPGVNQMGSLDIEKHYPSQGYSYIHEALANIKGTNYTNMQTVSIYIPGKTPIQLVLCDNTLIGSRTLTQYIQQTTDFTVMAGTFDGTTLTESYSNYIDTGVAVYTDDIPQVDGSRYHLDWMLYRLQKLISRGFTVYFERQQQIDDWNDIPNNPPIWGATSGSSTECPFNIISQPLVLSPVSFTVPVISRMTIADFSGVQFDDLLVDATYSLKFEIPENAPRTVFSAYLTEVGLNTQTINKLNTDTIVLAAQYGKFMSFSYNGIDWTNVPGPANLKYGNISKITYNESFWAAAGIWGSTDEGTIGITDPSGIIVPPSLTGTSFGAAWNGLSGTYSRYLTFGLWTNSDSTTGILSSSVDGITWTPAYYPKNEYGQNYYIEYAAIPSRGIYSILWNGTMWIMGCFISGYYTLLRSTNGINWTECTIQGLTGANPPYRVSGYPKKIAWNGLTVGARYVAAGNWILSNGSQRSFITSTDGITWSFVDNPPYVDSTLGYGLSGAYDVIWTGFIWIAVGRWETAAQQMVGGPVRQPLGDITISEDGTTWLTPVYAATGNNFSGPVFGANSIATNDSYVIVTGNWNGKSIVKSSSNRLGYAWTNIIKPTGILTDTVNLNCIVNTDTLHVAGGTWEDSDGNLFGTMASSTDGKNWPSATYPRYLVDSLIIEGSTNAIGWNDLSGVNSRFIAVGFWNDAEWESDFYKMSICTSTDGQVWTGENNPNGEIGTGYCVKYVSYVTSGGGDYQEAGGMVPGLRPYGGPAPPTNPPTWWIGGNWISGSISRSQLDTGNNIIWNVQPFHPGNALSGTCYGIAANSDGSVMVAVGKWQVPSGVSNPPTLTKTVTYSTDYGVTWATPVNPDALDDEPNLGEIGNAESVAKSVLFDGVVSFIIGGSWYSSTDRSTYSIVTLITGKGTPFFYNLSIPTIKGKPPSNTLPQITNSIGYNGKEYIATGHWGNMTLCTSIDTRTWTNLDNPNSIAKNNSVGTGIIWNSYTSNWVAAGTWYDNINTQYANVVLFKYGISWSVPFNPSNTDTCNSRTVVWNPNTSKWIMGGTFGISGTKSTVRTISESSDGLVWSIPINYGQVSSPDIRAILVKGAYNLLFGHWTLASRIITYSSDALQWSYPAYLPGVFSATKLGIQYKNDLWYLYGKFLDSDNKVVATVLYSSNLIEWDIAYFPKKVTDYQLVYPNIVNCVNDMVWNGSLWIAIGAWDGVELGIGERGEIFVASEMPRGIFSTSLNGITWELPTTPANLSFPGDNLKPSGNTLTWNGTIYVATGVFTADGLQSFTRSTDGVTWSNPVIPIGIQINTSIITAVACNEYIWVAIGSWTDADGYTYTMAYSYDGIMWNVVTSLTIYSSSLARTISWNGTMWIVGGYWTNTNNNFTGNIMTSFDGINWTIRTNPMTNPPNDVGNSVNSVTATGTRRSLPYTGQQLFSSLITNQSANKLDPIGTNSTGSVVTWASDPTYKNGTNYLTYLYNSDPLINSPTFTFVATKRTQWLTFGTYYTLSPVKITLTLISPQRPKVVSDLVGPHFSWTNSLGHALINNVTLRIGGTLVDTIPGQLMEILDEFQTPLERVNETSNLICRDIKGFNQSRFGTQTTAQTVTTPIPFWFSRGDPGCFLPIDALNIDEVRITVQFNPVTSLYYSDSRATTPAGQIIESATPGAALWPLADSQFYYEDLSGTTLPGLEPLTTTGEKFLPFPKIKMPATYTIPESYLMVEYIYLDKPEANRFRIADIQVPIVQHYTFDPVDNQNNPNVRVPLVVPNPTRDLFFYCNRYEAAGYNAPFLGTRDLSNNLVPQAPWWPDSSGLDDHYYETVRPAYSTRNSEPIRWLSLDYSETLNRYSTENVALFRSVLPSIEQRKAPFVNRYYYNFPLGIQNGFTPFSMPIGQANLDKVLRLNLTLGFHGKSGIINDMYIDRYNTYVFAETYNIFRVYGGRGGMMFAY